MSACQSLSDFRKQVDLENKSFVVISLSFVFGWLAIAKLSKGKIFDISGLCYFETFHSRVKSGGLVLLLRLLCHMLVALICILLQVMHKVTVGYMVGGLCCPILARSTFSSVWFFSFTCSFSGSVLLVAVNFLQTVYILWLFQGSLASP
jgi:hypothetical protein